MKRLIVLFLLLLAPASLAGAVPAWDRTNAEQLLGYVDGIAGEGLDPRDYDADALRRALAGTDASALNGRATATFLHLAADLGSGHQRDRRSVAWHIVGQARDAAASDALLQQALASHAVVPALQSLLPQHRQYRLLKAALAATPAHDKAGIERLRANLERWRWMPRRLGDRYLLVNVPAFTVSLVEGDRVVERRRVIVGKRSTPTPQFQATVTGVIFNPWWDVPQSIVRESVGSLLRRSPALARARGYTTAGGRIRQKPGPGNALGQVKLCMPNPFAVYLPDTPGKQLFDEETRAFSHGCIRTQDAIGLAATLLRGQADWSRDDVDRVVQAGRTREVALDRPLPVYVVYLTAAADDSGAIATFPDVYGRDGPVVSALVDRETRSIP